MHANFLNEYTSTDEKKSMLRVELNRNCTMKKATIVGNERKTGRNHFDMETGDVREFGASAISCKFSFFD